MISDKFKKINNERFYFKTLPSKFLQLLDFYFRLEIEGAENIPSSGPALITPNHSGFAGIDALLVNHSIIKKTKRIPRVLAHKLWFKSKYTGFPLKKMGFYLASLKNGNRLLNKKNVVVIFPEGETGNFKPSNKMYQLQEFKRGFIRLAIENQTPIIPTIVIGAEESNFNFSQIKFKNFFKGLILPLPFNFIPLPTKWRIKFLDPIYLPYDQSILEDENLIHDLAIEIQEEMQKKINIELKKRKSIF